MQLMMQFPDADSVTASFIPQCGNSEPTNGGKKETGHLQGKNAGVLNQPNQYSWKIMDIVSVMKLLAKKTE